MLIHDCEQGTTDWFKARLGKPTSSEFKKILQSKYLKPSESRHDYASRLATELITGEVSISGSSAWMERGRALEAKAIRWYEWHKDVDVIIVGFVSDDKERYGCSPDGLVGVNGGVEIKNPSAENHGIYIDKPEKLVAHYRLQVQGSLWVTKLDYWDLVSYNPTPEMRSICVRVLPDPEVFAALDKAIPEFLDLIQEKKQQQLNKPAEIPLSEMVDY